MSADVSMHSRALARSPGDFSYAAWISSSFEAHVDYFLDFFFYVKVQIHAVISCHTK